MSVPIVADRDLEQLAASDAVRWVRDAILAEHAGRLVAPPRVHTDVGDGRLVFTTGALVGDWFGYRSYATFGAADQLVAVQDATSGRLRGLAVGADLGPIRVGAIGAVAADALAPSGASTLALIGTGTQAWRQLWAISSVRELSRVRVFSRTPERRKAFAQHARTDLGLPCQVSDSAVGAVADADMVVLATNSSAPVVPTEALAPNAYVTTLGPKQIGRAEFGQDLVTSAALAVTDSVAQIGAYDPPNILAGTPHADRLVSLGAVVSGEVDRPRSGRTIFCSVGLAGTEAYLLARLLDRSPEDVRAHDDRRPVDAARSGSRPTTSGEGPHRQLDQRSTPQLWGELVDRVFRLEGVSEGASQVSPPSSRAAFLVDMADERAPETSLAPGRRLEPVHVHGVHDTSVHLVLPPGRGR
ncbi:MAG: hypothetical protein L0K86_12375, partial [Actinomycetia bacterium]|nr:hypothetical protein [Actinomycetes bacterium]